jgi:hypothetical protein
MGKTAERNKHQKAAHRPGERKVSREQVAELLELSCSSAPEDRLVAAQLLCPCHVRTHVPGVWDAVYRMMSDADRRVRYAAWHTLEDGGLPQDPQIFAALEHLLRQETDAKVRKFAEYILGNEIRRRNRQEIERLHVLARPVQRQQGKCDFCGQQNVLVERDFDTMIPAAGLSRPALICDRCAQNN